MIRVAIVASYRRPCGIGDFARRLARALPAGFRVDPDRSPGTGSRPTNGGGRSAGARATKLSISTTNTVSSTSSNRCEIGSPASWIESTPQPWSLCMMRCPGSNRVGRIGYPSATAFAILPTCRSFPGGSRPSIGGPITGLPTPERSTTGRQRRCQPIGCPCCRFRCRRSPNHGIGPHPTRRGSSLLVSSSGTRALNSWWRYSNNYRDGAGWWPVGPRTKVIDFSSSSWSRESKMQAWQIEFAFSVTARRWKSRPSWLGQPWRSCLSIRRRPPHRLRGPSPVPLRWSLPICPPLQKSQAAAPASIWLPVEMPRRWAERLAELAGAIMTTCGSFPRPVDGTRQTRGDEAIGAAHAELYAALAASTGR